MQKISIDNTINIITDASVKHMQNGTYISVPGYIITDEKHDIGSNVTPVFNSTNNEGEIMAIFNGLSNLIRSFDNNYLKNKKINVFSDSLLCVKSLREWIFKWRYNEYNVFINSSGTNVSNQNIIKFIIDLIIKNKVEFNIYHIKGHSEHMSIDSIKELFIQLNNIDIDYDYLQYILCNNRKIDMLTRSIFSLYTPDELSMMQSFNLQNVNKDVIIPILNKNDIDNYSNLILNKVI